MGLGSDNGEKRNEKDSEEFKNITLSTISVLVTGGEAQGKIAPSQILKTHKALQEKSIMMLTDFQASYFDAVSRERKEFLVDFMICYALFQYWSIGIDAARQVIDSMLSALGSERSQDGKFNFSGSKDHEEILVFFCKLLQYHSRNNVCPVKPLRNLLLLSLASFPESPFFLHSYVILELRSCLSTSLRRYFHRVLPDSKTPLPWLFAIHYEKQRLEAFQSVTMRPVKVTASKDMEVYFGILKYEPYIGKTCVMMVTVRKINYTILIVSGRSPFSSNSTSPNWSPSSLAIFIREGDPPSQR